MIIISQSKPNQSTAHITEGIQAFCSARLHGRFGRTTLSFLFQAQVEDGTTVFLIRDAKGQKCAVLLLSADIAPDMVARSISRAAMAKRVLSAKTGRRILEPILEARLDSKSLAVLPYCTSLSIIRPVNFLQKRIIGPKVLDWLLQLTRETVHPVASDTLASTILKPLSAITNHPSLSPALRAAALRAALRATDGIWLPRHVLMHGDFWLGNLLILPRSVEDNRGWSDRFVIIDWPDALEHGYGMFDLLRIATSLKLTSSELRREVERHCHVLCCDTIDALSHLLTCLGHISLSSEHLSNDRFALMAERCYQALICSGSDWGAR